MGRFKTLVFLDFEATGVVPYVYKRNVGITEMSLIAVESEEFQLSKRKPRVVNKITICVQPRSEISPGAMQISGLHNSMLEGQNPFTSSTASLLLNFLNILEQPVCLLAYNGSRFDFPLLQAELKRVEVTLPDTVYCMDALSAIQQLENEICKNYDIEHVPHNPPASKPASKIPKQTKISNFTTILDTDLTQPCKEIDGYGMATQQTVFDIIDQNLYPRCNYETTPPKNEVSSSTFTPPKRQSFAFNDEYPDVNLPTGAKIQTDYTPTKAKIEVTSTVSTPRKIKAFNDESPNAKRAYIARSKMQTDYTPYKPRRLYFGPKKFWPSNKMSGFKLDEVYQRFFGKEIENNHQAEADTLALIEITQKLEGFVDFVEYNAKQFGEIEPMWN